MFVNLHKYNYYNELNILSTETKLINKMINFIKPT